MSDAKATGTEDFPARLNMLFATCVDDDGLPWSIRAIAKRCAQLGHPISEPYISQLRKGKTKSPSFHVACTLADAFGVDITHFTPEALPPDSPRGDFIAHSRLLTSTEELLAEQAKLLAQRFGPESVAVALRILVTLRLNAPQTPQTHGESTPCPPIEHFPS